MFIKIQQILSLKNTLWHTNSHSVHSFLACTTDTDKFIITDDQVSGQ